MGENAICTKQTEEEWGKTEKEKLTSKRLSNPTCTLATSVELEGELQNYI